MKAFLLDLFTDLAATDSQIMALVILLVVVVIVLDAISTVAKRKRKDIGLENKKSYERSVQGTNTSPVKNYVSDMQGLAGTPDAVIEEEGHFIPIERKPLAKKIRDRYVAQLLVYMRLIEEFEGKRPPYGYLILGPNCRKVRIFNSEKRQAWLQKQIDEMQAILTEEKMPKATPHKQKCSRCSVRNECEFKFVPENKPAQK